MELAQLYLELQSKNTNKELQLIVDNRETVDLEDFVEKLKLEIDIILHQRYSSSSVES
jgi:hypothetical protein